MGQSSGPFRFLLVVLAFVVTGAATVMGIRLGFGLLVLYVVAGLSIFLAFISLMLRPGVRSDRARSHLRPADPGFYSYVMDPAEAYPGYCWQCGRRVKLEGAVCLHCGATLTHRRAPVHAQESELPWEASAPRFSGGLTRWDSTPGTPLPWGQSPSSRPLPPPVPQPVVPPPAIPQPVIPQPAVPQPAARTPRALSEASELPNQRVAPHYQPGAPPPWIQQRQPAPAEPARRRRRW